MPDAGSDQLEVLRLLRRLVTELQLHADFPDEIKDWGEQAVLWRLDGALSAAAMQAPADHDSSAAEARARAVVGEPEWDLLESAVTSSRISRMLYRVILLAANTVAERRADR